MNLYIRNIVKNEFLKIICLQLTLKSMINFIINMLIEILGKFLIMIILVI